MHDRQNYHVPAIETALAAYEQARLDGLCHDGAWECALETVRSLPPASSELRQQIITQLRLLIEPVRN
jgi:hypothetical protein